MRGHALLEITALVAGGALFSAGLAAADEPPPAAVQNEKSDSNGAPTSSDSAAKLASVESRSPSGTIPPSRAVEAPLVSSLPGGAVKTSGNINAKPTEDSALPRRIPGYELRVLDVRKDVFFHVNGTWIQSAIPIYFYFPTQDSERNRGVELLRQARLDARKLGEISAEKAPELERVIANLEAAIAALEKQP